MKLAAVALSLALALPALRAQEAAPPLSSSDLVKAHRNNLVFVIAADGAGSGFICNLGGANFLVTNAHVAAGAANAGFKRLDGTKVQVGGAAAAVGHDILRMQVAAGGTPLQMMRGVEENTAIDDEIVVLGNAEGAGVINTIKGKIVGLGPNLVEVDAPFVPGNSGSPIIHLKSGKVIGVATFLTVRQVDPATRQAMRAPVVRRFGYRLDSVKAWQLVVWPAFYAQAAELARIEALSEDLGKFFMDLSRNRQVTPGLHTNPVIKTRIDAWTTATNRRMSARDFAAADQNFLSFMKVTCQSDVMAARQRFTYDYFQRALTEQEQQRRAMADVLDRVIREMQKAR